MELIIEQVSRAKKLIKRYKVTGPHVTIGRGFDNDIILTDPYVCAQHLSLNVDEQGQWRVNDCDSVNGSFVDEQRPLENQQAVNSGDVIAIGKSHFRIIDPQQAVAPTIKLSGIEGLLNWLNNPLVGIMIFAVFIGLLSFDYYLEVATEIQPSKMFSSVLFRFIGISMVPLLFALLARMFKHDARTLILMLLCYAFVILLVALGGVHSLLRFNLNQGWIIQWFGYMFHIGLLFSFFWISCYIAFHQGTLRRTIISSGATAAIFALVFINQASSSGDFDPKPRYDHTLLAPEFSLASPVTVVEFIGQSESVFDLAIEKIDEK